MDEGRTSECLDREALDQHRLIHFFLERLERSVESLDGEGGEERLRRLPAELDSFRHHLEEHNRAEVDGGLLQSALDALPDDEDEILHLSDQNDRLVDAVGIALLRSRESSIADVGELRAELLELVRRVRDHERCDEHLLERALLAGTAG